MADARTGRDVIVGALLALTSLAFNRADCSRLWMMRKCHLNTCPVGIATQNAIAQGFTGTPEHVINYFFFVAQQMRELLAAMANKLDQIIGQNLPTRAKRLTIKRHKGSILPACSPKLRPTGRCIIAKIVVQLIDDILDRKLIAEAMLALENKIAVKIDTPITNIDRSAGTMLSGALPSATAAASRRQYR